MIIGFYSCFSTRREFPSKLPNIIQSLSYQTASKLLFQFSSSFNADTAVLTYRSLWRIKLIRWM